MLLRLGDQSISLDRADSEVCFVSHAHSDHTGALKSKGRVSRHILSSKETVDLAKYTGKPVSHSLSWDGVLVSLLDAGHVLGSKQLYAQFDGGTFVYTGDFKLRDGFTTKAAEVRNCDHLVIEGTYGDGSTIFPDRMVELGNLSNWVSKQLEFGSVILGAYSLGKAQELVAALNAFGSIEPIVHPRVEAFCGVYEKHGIRLKRVPSFSEEAGELFSRNFVAVLPHHLVNHGLSARLSSLYGKKFFSALATGWGMRYAFPVNKVFSISDHADFNEIVSYVEQATPKQVLCCHGNEERLSHALREKGFNARPLSQASQQTLF